ncbi:MAG: hypothetical protein ACRBBP_07885 [Bdellovibrionales bacterium]
MQEKFKEYSKLLDGAIFLFSGLAFGLWFLGVSVFSFDGMPELSIFTIFSLLLMSGSRLADKMLSTWSYPMTLALLGVVACGNLSSLWIQLTIPDLFLNTMPGVVPTSAMTSIGLILFCFYEILVVLRKTPQTAFILDDVLLHLALFPGGLSFLGHFLGVQAYMSSSVDPRAGIGVVEMLIMGVYATGAVISNPNLFLWKFLAKSKFNKVVFLTLFINQYLAPIAVGLAFRPEDWATDRYGLEFYVMLAGVLATLIFLVINALRHSFSEEESVLEDA